MDVSWRNFVFVLCLAVVRCLGSGEDNSKKQQGTELNSDFDCNGKVGFYADINRNCSIFYYCQWDSAKLTLSCPEDTWFNQKHQQCEGGERKQCFKSKKYYPDGKKLLLGSEHPKQELPNRNQRRRFKRQALYIPPSTLNTFVVRYYVPSGAASVSEHDTFGSNAAIYLPEHYRIAVNPDSEPAIHLTRPVAPKEQYTKTKIHNAEKPTESPSKTPYSNSLQDTVHKPVFHSTRRPEPIRRPDTERIIRPPNQHDKNLQDPRQTSNNYNHGRFRQDDDMNRNYHHSQYSVPSRDESTYIHHPRKAGHKLYHHPGDYSSPAHHHRPAPLDNDYEYGDTTYRPSQPKYVHRYPGSLYEDTDDDSYFYHNRPREEHRSHGYSYPAQNPPYLLARPYQNYPKEIPYTENSPGPEAPRYTDEDEQRYKETGKSNEQPHKVIDNDNQNKGKEEEYFQKGPVPYNHQEESERPRNSAIPIENQRSPYGQYEKPETDGEQHPSTFRENHERYKSVPYVQYLNEGGEVHESGERPPQEQIEYKGRGYGPSQERNNANIYNEGQHGSLNNGPVTLDKFHRPPNDEYNSDRYREEERTENSGRPPFAADGNYENSYAGGVHDSQHSEKSIPDQQFVERDPTEKLTKEEERLPISSKDHQRSNDQSKTEEASLEGTKLNDQSRTALLNEPENTDYSQQQKPHSEYKQHILLPESGSDKGARSHYETPSKPISHKDSYTVKTEGEYTPDHSQKSAKERIPENKPSIHSGGGHLTVSTENKYPNENYEKINTKKDAYLKDKNSGGNTRTNTGDRIFTGSTHYINNNENTNSNKNTPYTEAEEIDRITTTEFPTALFGNEKFGDRIVKPSDNLENQDSANRERQYLTTTTQTLPPEFYESPRLTGDRAAFSSQTRLKDISEYEKATPVYQFFQPYVRYKEIPAKSSQNSNPVGQRTLQYQDAPKSYKDGIAQIPHRGYEETSKKAEHQIVHDNHRKEHTVPPGFQKSHFSSETTVQRPIENHQEVEGNHKKTPHAESSNHRQLQPKLVPVYGNKGIIIHKDKAIIGRHHDLQYSEPSLSAAQDKVPAYVTVTPPVTSPEYAVTQPFTFIDTKAEETSPIYPLTYDSQATTETSIETSTVRIRKAKRRRKKGRRRRPKRPRVKTADAQEQASSYNNTKQQLPHTTLTETAGTTFPTTSAYRHYNEKENVKLVEQAETRSYRTDPTTIPVTTAQPQVGSYQSNPIKEDSAEQARKRQVRYRNRKRKFRPRTTTSSTPTEESESSPEKSFTFQGMDDVTTSPPVTPYRAARTRVMRHKSRTRPRLFGFGKPKISEEYSDVPTTTASSTPT